MFIAEVIATLVIVILFRYFFVNSTNNIQKIILTISTFAICCIKIKAFDATTNDLNIIMTSILFTALCLWLTKLGE